jgi:hypothetical protein
VQWRQRWRPPCRQSGGKCSSHFHTQMSLSSVHKVPGCGVLLVDKVGVSVVHIFKHRCLYPLYIKCRAVASSCGQSGVKCSAHFQTQMSLASIKRFFLLHMFIHKKQVYTLFTRNGTRVTNSRGAGATIYPPAGKNNLARG